MISTQNKTPITLAISLSSILLVSATAMAEQHTEIPQSTDKYESYEPEQHDAHEHGTARLTLALSEKGVEIALESPAANLFGFEHNASDGADEATIYEAAELLEDSDTLFRMPEDAGCVLHDFEIESALIEMHDDEQSDDDSDKHSDDNTDKHSNEGSDQHDKDQHQLEAAHNDVDVLWNFNCKNMAELKRVEIKLFSAFPEGFEKINVEWISPTQASQIVLEGDGAVLLAQ